VRRQGAGATGQCCGRGLVSTLPENWWAAVKWQCHGVFSSVALIARINPVQ